MNTANGEEQATGGSSPPHSDTLRWLFYDDDLELFGCRTCHLAFATVDGVRAHIKSNNSPHPEGLVLPISHARKIKNKPDAISSMKNTSNGEITPNWAQIYKNSPLQSMKGPSAKVRAIPWLCLHDGYSCPLCKFCHRTSESVEVHLQKSHPMEWKLRTAVLRLQVKKQLVQTLLLGKAAKYFPVTLDPKLSYWYSRGKNHAVVAAPQGVSKYAGAGSIVATTGSYCPLGPKTFDEITKLCGHDGLDGTKPRRGIFDELVKANAAVSQTLLFTTHDESPETGYGNTHKYSLFLALSRFDITLQQCGFHSFPKVPMELSTIDGIDSQDCSFKRLQTDIVGYLRFCGTFIYDSAPYIRDMLQLTGYAGSNLRKFKSVEESTLTKYSGYLAHMLLIVLRTFSSTAEPLHKKAGRKLFPAEQFGLYEKLTSSYVSSLSKRREEPPMWTELSELFTALFLVHIPGESSTSNLAVRQLLALMSVTEDKQNNDTRIDKYFTEDPDDDMDGKRNGMRRFKSGSEMSHLFASILYCTSCTGVYAIRCGGHKSKPKVDFVRKAVSLRDNTAVAFVRDLLDKTSADRNSDSSDVRFSVCLENTHARDACGVIDGNHLSMCTVRAGLVKIEEELHRLLEYDLLLTLPVPLKEDASVIKTLRDRHTDPRTGFSFMEMKENKEMVESNSQALLEHVVRGIARTGGWAIDNNTISAGDSIGEYFLQCSDGADENDTLSISGDRFVERTVRCYLQKCQRFLQLILVYSHVVGGGPPRCTEICTLRHRNGPMEKRNLFIDHSMFCFLHRYNKTRNASEKEAAIARFLPRQASNLLLVYLSYVKPLENLFSRALVKKDAGASSESAPGNSNWNEFLFTSFGELYSASKIREIISREFCRLGYSTNASQWRQFQNGMEREFMQVVTDRSGDIEECHDKNCFFISVMRYSGESEFKGDPTQAGHSRRRADLSYARTGEIPRGISYTAYMRHRKNSILWHNLLGICCAKRRDQYIKKIAVPASRPCFKQKDVNMSELTKDVVSELLPLLSLKRGPCNVDEYTSQGSPPKKQKLIHYSEGHRECSTGTCQHQELSLYQEYLPYLRSMTRDPNAEFRSRHQLCAIATALHGKRDMLFVMGTGSGKTMIYLLVSYIEAKRAKTNRTATPLTIVVVPTRALVQDILKRCKALGITAVSWNNRKSDPEFEDAAVILLAVEQVLVNEYAPFLEEMRAKGRLARIVSEECHLMIQWQSFRPHMNEIRHRIFGNIGVPIPIIMASATVSPAQERSVIDAHGVNPERLSILRHSTHRSNIAYSVLFTKPDTVEKTTETDKMARCVIDSIEKYRSDICGGEDQRNGSAGNSDDDSRHSLVQPRVSHKAQNDLRILIYCPTKDICRKVGSAISNHAVNSGRNWTCAQYTADLDTEDKDSVFKFWIKEEEGEHRESPGTKRSEAFFVPQKRGLGTRIVVATSAFGTGIDVPDVRIVFHIGFCRGLHSFAQESGRAGRDNRPSKSIVVYSSRLFDAYVRSLKDRTMKKVGVEDSPELMGMIEFSTWALDSRKCRRKTLFERLDATPPPSCIVSRYTDSGVSLCDSCAVVSSLHKAGLGLSMGEEQSRADLETSQETVQSDVVAALAAASSPRSLGVNWNTLLSESEHEACQGTKGGTPARKSSRRSSAFHRNTQTPKNTTNVRTTSTTSKQKMSAFIQMARKLKDACAFCFVEKLKHHEGREDCLAPDACFNCFERGRTHSFKDCPLDLSKLLEMDEASCKACGLNRCMGTRLHKSTEWNYRGSCPYRSLVEMFFVAWRSPYIRRKLCKKLDRAEIYVLPEGHRNFTAEQTEIELLRFIRCVLSTSPGETLPNIICATDLLFETIGYTFTL